MIFVKSAAYWRGEPAPNRYTELLDLISRVDEGADLDELRAEREREHAEFSARRRAEELAKPAPKDKTSDGWRYWKLRRTEAGFQSGEMETYKAAWREFWDFFDGFRSDPDRTSVSTALEILPALLVAYQRAEEIARRELRSQAAMRGVRTRQAKKGGGS